MFFKVEAWRLLALPRLNSSQLEVVKWVGLVAMLLDHANKAFFAGGMFGWSELGRLAFPLFAFSLAHGVDGLSVPRRVHIFRRVFVCACVSQVFFWALWGRSDGNVIFTLAMALLVFVGWDVRRDVGVLFGVLALVGSTAVEFDWPGLLMTLAVFASVRVGGFRGVVLMVLGLSMVNFPNGNTWAYWAVPVLFGISGLDVRVPRVRGLFYWLYPSHMALFWLLLPST